MKRLAIALAVVAMAAACKKAEEQPADAQMMADTSQMMADTGMMADSAMMGDSAHMQADSMKQETDAPDR